MIPLLWILLNLGDHTQISHCALQALAAEMAPNTRVNCVAPGFVPTHFAAFITTNADVVRF